MLQDWNTSHNLATILMQTYCRVVYYLCTCAQALLRDICHKQNRHVAQIVKINKLYKQNSKCVRSFSAIWLSMEFVFVHTVTLCPENYHRKLRRRDVGGCHKCCEIGTVNPTSRKSLQISSLQSVSRWKPASQALLCLVVKQNLFQTKNKN
jgi:hypothetical protein